MNKHTIYKRARKEKKKILERLLKGEKPKEKMEKIKKKMED